MNRLPDLVVFSKLARGAMLAIHTRTLEQPPEHRWNFEAWCFETQFARIFEAGSAVL